MADIFVSYARGDAKKVERLVRVLEAAGFSVWSDVRVPGGAEFSKDIERELATAKAVIVAWSAEANDSRWVRDEAEYAANADKLVAVSLDGAEPPMGFKQFHAINLVRMSEATLECLKDSLALKMEAPRTAHAAETSSRGRTQTLLLAATLVIGALAIGFGAMQLMKPPVRDDQARQGAPASSESGAVDTSSQTSAGANSIAVLPFVNMSPEQDQEYFSDGVAEEILNGLVQLTDLRVTGRTSSFAFKGKNIDIRTIGETLGVAHVLEGSVRRQGDRVRISAQLIKADDGFHLWSETFDRDYDDIFAIQEEIARAVAENLNVVFARGPGEQAVIPPTDDEEAYTLFLQGRYLFERRVGENLPKSIALFEAAIHRDPSFARAYSALAAAHAILPQYLNVDYENSIELAAEYAGKAAQLAPDLAEPHGTLAFIAVRSRSYVEAQTEYDRAAAIDPDDIVTAMWRGGSYLSLGRLRDAEIELERAVALDPVSPRNLLWLSVAKWLLGDFDAVEQYASMAMELGFPAAAWPRGEAAAQNNDLESAARFAETAIVRGGIVRSLDRDEAKVVVRGMYGDEAQKAEAVALLEEKYAAGLLDRDSFAPYAMARLGDIERAFEMFEAHRYPLDEIFLSLLWTPLGRETRQHPGFAAFAERVGLLDYWRDVQWPDLCRPIGDGDAFVCD